METKISSDLLLNTGIFNTEKIKKKLKIVKQNNFDSISFEEASSIFFLLTFYFSDEYIF